MAEGEMFIFENPLTAKEYSRVENFIRFGYVEIGQELSQSQAFV